MKSYSSRILEKALAPTIRAIDVLGFTIPPIVAAYYWLIGRTMPEAMGQAIGLWILGGGLAFVILRVLSAPYFVWKEDQAAIAELRSTLAAPQTREAAELWKHRLELRRELGECLGWIITFSEYATSNSGNPKILDQMYSSKECFAKEIRAREIISQLSYDVPLRVMSLNLLKLTSAIIRSHSNPTKANALIERLWAQRKLTFRFLHRQDLHELITLAEVENLIAEYGEGFGESGLSEIRKLISENPEVLRSLTQESMQVQK